MTVDTSDLSGTVFFLLRLAIAVALYVFLVWAMVTLWRELNQQKEISAFQGVPLLELDLQTIEGTVPYRFTISEVLIGRDPGSDCHLEDLTVSNRHARLSYHNSQWWVEDLGSTNGTYLNQERVETPIVLTSGDELKVGQLQLTIHIDGDKAM